MESFARLQQAGRQTLQENVYQALKAALMAGEFAPGQQLTVRQVAELAGTSAMPAREAMRRLVSERALQLLPNGSMRVCLMSRRQRDQAREIRCLLEGRAARHAAQLIDREALRRLEALNQEMLQAMAAGDLRRAVQINREFHFAIYRAADSERLFQIIESLWMENGPQIMVLAQRSPADGALARGTRRNHGDLIAALRARDPDAAERAVHADIATTAEIGEETGDQQAAAPARPARRRRPAA